MMPIPFNYKLKKIVRSTDLTKILKDNNSEWVAWWYGGIYKNFRAKTVPLIAVVFRKLINNTLTDEVTCRHIPVSLLGQVRLGSIWKDGKCSSQAVFESYNNVVVDFTEGEWSFNSFYESIKANQSTPYLDGIHHLAYPKDRNWFLEFPIPTGGKLVIPCMEFFVSCYGHSEEVNRILTTYPWGSGQDSVVERLTAPIDVPDDGRWIVNLQPSISNDDAVLVAHLKYDQLAQSRAKEIYAQLESAFTADNQKPAFIKVSPWFEGLAELNVEGIWFDNKKSFLALRVNGVSDPQGVPIERYRRYKNKGEMSSSAINADIPPIVIPRGNTKFPEIVRITSDDEPDRGSSTVEIFNDARVKLGVARLVLPAKLTKIGNRNVIVTSGSSNQSEFSTGEAHGTGKGVGQASIYAKSVLESHGTLRDVWNAMLFLKKEYPLQITSVDWFTFEDGFKSDCEPSLINLQPFDGVAAEGIKNSISNWCYLDIQNKTPRGILVTRIIVDGKCIFILEIQRKQRNKISEDDVMTVSEESYKGFVFTLLNNNDFESSLRRFMNKVRMVRGIMQNLTADIVGQADTFKHVSAAGEQSACEAAVVNALCKVGINLGV